jgi:hypothetical protein
MKALAVAGVALLVLACQAPSALRPLHAAADPPAELQVERQLFERIESEIGSAPCTSDRQCRTLAVGAKACGGPAAWWSWSDAHSDAGRLQAWAQELDRLQRARFERMGLASNCQSLRCVLNARPDLR